MDAVVRKIHHIHINPYEISEHLPQVTVKWMKVLKTADQLDQQHDTQRNTIYGNGFIIWAQHCGPSAPWFRHGDGVVGRCIFGINCEAHFSLLVPTYKQHQPSKPHSPLLEVRESPELPSALDLDNNCYLALLTHYSFFSCHGWWEQTSLIVPRKSKKKSVVSNSWRYWFRDRIDTQPQPSQL